MAEPTESIKRLFQSRLIVRFREIVLACFRITRAILRLVLFLALVGAFLFDTSAWIGSWSIAARFGGAAMAAFMAHAFTDRTFKARIRKSSHEAEFVQLDTDRARQLQDEIRGAGLITPEQADVFIRAIVVAPKLHQRIIEKYRTNQRTMQREVTIDVRIPRHIMRRALEAANGDSAKVTFLYPVIVPPKGVFYDDLQIYGATGEKLTTLSYREYLHIAASVIHLLMALSCDELPVNLPSDAVEAERQAIWGLIRRIDTRSVRNMSASGMQASREPEGSSKLSAARAIEIAGRDLAVTLQTLASVKHDDTRRRAIRMAAQLTEVLYSHYAIVASVTVPASGRFSLKYDCTVIPELDMAPKLNRLLSIKAHRKGKLREFAVRKLRAFVTRLHIFLSTRPADVKISLDNAWTCQSYHVLVRGPDGMYLTHQELSVPHVDYLQRRARWAPSLPHVRFRRRLGQPYAHFYARFLPAPRRAAFKDDKITRSAEKAPKLLLNFQEIPPGSICPAALAAIAAAALVWIIGYGLSHASKGDLSTDAPVLLLAFPGVAASWLGFDGASRLFEGTLTARLSLAFTAAISLVAAGLYVLRTLPSSVPLSVHVGASKLGLLGITLWPWAALTGVALFNASYLCYRWIITSWRFRHLADRDDPAALVAKVRQEEEGDDEAEGT